MRLYVTETFNDSGRYAAVWPAAREGECQNVTLSAVTPTRGILSVATGHGVQVAVVDIREAQSVEAGDVLAGAVQWAGDHWFAPLGSLYDIASVARERAGGVEEGREKGDG